MNLSQFAETGFLNVLRGITFAAPSQVFCGLFLTSPGESGTAGTEVAYTGYARMPITFEPPTPESAGIGIRNDAQLTFAESAINAGTVRFIGVFDSATGGNMYLYGELTEDLPIVQGESPVLLLRETLFFTIGNLSMAYKTRLFNIVRGQTLSGFESYCALYNGDPENGGSELLGGNYQRVLLNFTAPTKNANGISVIVNIQLAEFPNPTVNWGNWTHTAIFDSQTGGEPVFIQQRATPKLLNKGIMPFIRTGGVMMGIN